jgi:hypothetical protein
MTTNRDAIGDGNGMTGREDNDPRVNHVLDDLEYLGGKETPCPVCGATTWVAYPNEVAIHLTNRGTGTVASIEAVALFCTNCRFVRFHGMSTSEGL